MKLTKYEHACFTVEKDDKVIVVDLGNMTGDFVAPKNVVAIIATHEHPDHFDTDLVAGIIDKNPDAIIIGPESVTKKAGHWETTKVTGGDQLSIGGFELKFFGKLHAFAHPAMPTGQNVGVLIDELIYFPGDALVRPFQPVDTLAVPAGAPWLKLSDAVDFMVEVKPRFAFPAHDRTLSESGRALADDMFQRFSGDIEYKRIDGETIDV